MPSPVERLKATLSELQDELDRELVSRRERLRYRIERGRAVFGSEVRQQHRAARETLRSFLGRTRPLVVLTAPVIYALIVPFVLLDLFVTLYQAICFPVYGIPKVRRAEHIVVDRHRLGYLNALQKLNCVYCGYANGVISYVREVAGRTERYWCPIRHALRIPDPHPHYADFIDYGDAEALQSKIEKLRRDLAELTGKGG